MLNIEEGRTRVVLESIAPAINGGEFPIKRVVGETVTVEVDAFTDGHDAISVVLRYRKEGDAQWRETPMTPLVNDRWRATFTITEMGRYCYNVLAWVDHFKGWARDFAKRVAADSVAPVDIQIGTLMIQAAQARADSADAARLAAFVKALRAGGAEGASAATSTELAELMHTHAERRYAITWPKDLVVWGERVRAKYGAWYSLFPRSTATEPGKHGTFKDVIARLPYIASMNFDVLYLTPIHPIGQSFRKGRNNTVTAEPGDPGSPYAIGSAEGGYRDILPELGTLEDFHELIARAAEHDIEIAMDVAFNASPEHPYVKEHPEWFKQRPDGTIQYAENPPKKYQDIYPFDFETEDWRAMWEELRDTMLYWIGQGIRIFRVDNPHTKAFGFWQWMIDSINREHPDVIWLSEAFTRPRVMYRLAKAGFTQSYNYFPWRNTKWELTQYFTEVTYSEVHEYFRPSLWPNTHDILPEYLQFSGRPGFITRFILAATFGVSYGIFGPTFELCVSTPLAPGREEYLDSEKYEIKVWDLDQPHSIRPIIARVNQIRRDNPALQSDAYLRFHRIDNDQIIAYSKTSEDGANQILVVVNLDPHFTQSGFVELPLEEMGLDPHQTYQVHDLLTDARYLWNGSRNYVELNPHNMPAHIFAIRRRVRTERDFDYYL
jgi:starch synthase (maltosyl-transferring)